MKLVAHPRVIERGILTSSYKQDIKNSLRKGIKQRALKNSGYFCCEMGTLLKVSLFFIAITIIVF